MAPSWRPAGRGPGGGFGPAGAPASPTPPLAVDGPELGGAGPGPGGWLEARVASDRSFPRALCGLGLEYRALRLRAREAGKREATLRWDGGQGTQDLGFRAEVPILFTV